MHERTFGEVARKPVEDDAVGLEHVGGIGGGEGGADVLFDEQTVVPR